MNPKTNMLINAVKQAAQEMKPSEPVGKFTESDIEGIEFCVRVFEIMLPHVVREVVAEYDKLKNSAGK